MNIFLLDAGGAAILILFPIAIVLFLFIWGLVEGLVIYLFKINLFWKSVWNAIIVNLISLAVGFLLIGLGNTPGFEKYFELDLNADIIGDKALLPWAVYFAISVIVEALMLKVLNKSINWTTIFLASLIMNILTYCIMYGYVFYSNQ